MRAVIDLPLLRAFLLLLVAALPANAVTLPMVCELTSEEVPSIKVLLTERTAVSLKGQLLQGSKTLGTSDRSIQWIRECLVVVS